MPAHIRITFCLQQICVVLGLQSRSCGAGTAALQAAATAPSIADFRQSTVNPAPLTGKG